MAFSTLGEAFSWIESFTNLERSSSLFSTRTYQLDRMITFATGAMRER